MVVRMRHTRSHTANRRSHHALKSPALSKDASGEMHIRHRASLSGMYKGRSVTGDPVKKVLKKQGKKVAKKAPAKAKKVAKK
ncbi:MAG: ribosomal protein [Patescibacteria group bacterium]|nr:ribosomal protein [Patescibacteria group bacterium]